MSAPAFKLTRPANHGYEFHCVVCGRHMVRYADPAMHAISPDLCDSPLCLDHWCRSQPIPPQVPVCSCSQRPYPHEITVHLQLRSESYNPKLYFTWPWSLMLSDRAELSTERKAA